MAVPYVKALMLPPPPPSDFRDEKTPENISLIYLEVAWNFWVQLL